MNEMVKNWMNRCKVNGIQFAMIQTIKAIFDRVAIVEETIHYLFVEYPKGDSKKGYVIKKERIPVSELQRIRYYQD